MSQDLWAELVALASREGTTPEALLEKALQWFISVRRYGVDGTKETS